MRNFARINNYYNRIEAWKDWNKIAKQAIDAGKSEIALRLKPPSDASWRTIDKAIAKLRAELEK